MQVSKELDSSMLESVLDSSRVGMCVLDSDFRVAFVNRAFLTYWGLSRSEAVGKDKRRLILERIKGAVEVPDAFTEKVLAAYEANVDSESIECHILPGNGREERWLEYWSQSIQVGPWAGGRIEHYIDITEREKARQASGHGVLGDTTGHKESQEVPKQDEERYRSLFEHSPVSLWEKDFSVVRMEMDRLRECGVLDMGVYLTEHPDEIRRLASLIRIIDVNRATLELFGAESKAELIRDFEKVFVDASLLTLKEQLIAIHEGRTGLRLQSVCQTLSGERRYISWQCSATPGNEDTLSKVLVSIVDMTELKQAEDERRKVESRLRQAQKMEAIGTLAGGVAHDFNNILAAIMGYADMAHDDAPEDSMIRNYLAEVLKAANRAKELTKQILLFSRKGEPSSGQDETGVEIGLVIKEALKLLRATLPTTIEIRQRLSTPRDSLVKADPTQIHQVLMNLCTNAAHAMRENGGLLEIGLSETDLSSDEESIDPVLKPGSYVKLTVRDTGHGMDGSTMERIFDPFFTTKAKGEGTGMGLSVVHGIVTSRGGAITVDSNPGQGSVFQVYFPRCDQSAAPASRSAVGLSRGKGRVLFVDDEQMMTNVGGQMLERLGYEVEAKTSSIDALELFRTDPDAFDVVITDYTMPRMTGIALAREIHAVKPDTPVILCTGFSEMVTEEKAKEAGVRAFVMKPLGMREIAAVVHDVLNEKV